MNNMLYISTVLAKNGMTMNERLSQALVMVVMGVLMVFAVLATIMVVLMLTARLFTKDNSPKKAEKPTATVASEPKMPTAPVVEPCEDDGAIVAAISAAISVMLAETGSTGKFRVVSFKRVDKKSAWNAK